jgi:hypothetical protein
MTTFELLSMSLIFLSIALFTGYHSFNNYDDIDFGNAVEIEHIYSPKVRGKKLQLYENLKNQKP